MFDFGLSSSFSIMDLNYYSINSHSNLVFPKLFFSF